MAYQKKKGYKSIGKTQRAVMIKLIDEPMTVHKLMDTTGLESAKVQSALKALLLKGYVVRDSHKFKLKQEDNEQTSPATAGTLSYSFIV